jgi:hypothetical protein
MGALSELGSRLRILARTPSIAPSGPPPEVPEEDLPEGTNEKTVAALLENLRLLVAYEEQRLNSLTTRASALAGFAGAGTALIAAGSGGHLALGVKLLLLLAAAALVFTAAAVVIGVLATHQATIQSTRQVSLYRVPSYWQVNPARVQKQTIDVLVTRLTDLRSQNQVRATWLNRASLALTGAVVFAAVAGAVRLFS